MAKRCSKRRRTRGGGLRNHIWRGMGLGGVGGGRKKMMRTRRRTRGGGQSGWAWPGPVQGGGGGRKKMMRTRRRTRRGGFKFMQRYEGSHV
jgi:hypothetical protein